MMPARLKKPNITIKPNTHNNSEVLLTEQDSDYKNILEDYKETLDALNMSPFRRDFHEREKNREAEPA